MKPLILLFAIVWLLSSCAGNKQEQQQTNNVDSTAVVEEPTVKQLANELNERLAKYETAPQTFRVTTKSTKVLGKAGTVIQVNVADLVTVGGKEVTGPVDVVLKELTTVQQMLNANVSTMSDGRMLESGGAYYINMTANGEQLKLKEGKTLKVELPVLSNKGMSLFYGQRDSMGQMNWKETPQRFKNKEIVKAPAAEDVQPLIVNTGIRNSLTDSTLSSSAKKRIKEEMAKQEIKDKVYSVINLSEFGWINCDRFPDIQRKTSVAFKFKGGRVVRYAKVYLVFKDIMSLMERQYSGRSDGNVFGNIPFGYKVKLVAVAVEKDKVYSFTRDFTVGENETIDIEMKETSDEQMQTMLN